MIYEEGICLCIRNAISQKLKEEKASSIGGRRKKDKTHHMAYSVVSAMSLKCNTYTPDMAIISTKNNPSTRTS